MTTKIYIITFKREKCSYFKQPKAAPGYVNGFIMIVLCGAPIVRARIRLRIIHMGAGRRARDPACRYFSGRGPARREICIPSINHLLNNLQTNSLSCGMSSSMACQICCISSCQYPCATIFLTATICTHSICG